MPTYDYYLFNSSPKNTWRYVLAGISVTIAVVIIVVVAIVASNSSDKDEEGVCVPGQRCFPDKKELASFNKSVNGRLHAERPIASVCYIDDLDFDAEACYQYGINATSGRYRFDHFPSYQFTNWEYCGLLNCSATDISTEICEQGSVPMYSVHAESAEDVRHYVKFATKHNLRIVVKNTGHDLLGRSSGKGGFAVWTHKMKDITIHDVFQPEGCSTNYEKAISLGAGVQWAEAYTAIHPHGRVVVGGLATSVGSAGGWVMGGGHSFLTPSYGLGADNLIEAEIVTADGKLRKISECSHSDLFWAIRGGGGGTWGVVTRVTYKTRPSVQLYTAGVQFSMDISNSTFKEMLKQWIVLAPVIGDLGVGGATILTPNSLSGLLVLPSSEASWTAFEEAVYPFAAWMEQQGNQVGSVTYTNYTGWFEYYMENFYQPDTVVFQGGGTPTRIIPRQYYENDPTDLVNITYNGLKYRAETGDMGPIIIGHASPVKLRGKPIGTSVNPIWYDSLWHIISSSDFIEGYRVLAPDAAVYFGESDVNEPDYAKGYWGTNYNRLLQVKKKWDPDNHFQVWHGVGTSYEDEEWVCYAQ